ncbi:MAG: hypothetical protein ABEJ56_05755 [Candidatus Nanohaloarchaea archaeon]
MKNDKQITLVVLTSLGIAGLGFFINSGPVLKYGVPGSILALYFAAYIIQNKSLPSAEDLKEEASGDNLLSQTSEKTAGDIVKQWAKKRNTSVNIDWQKTDFDTKELRDWDQVLRAVIGALDGADNKQIFFVDMVKEKVVGKKRIRTKDHEVKPYKYCDHYQEYKRRTQSGGLPEGQSRPRRQYGQIPQFLQPNTMHVQGGQRQTGNNNGDSSGDDE